MNLVARVCILGSILTLLLSANSTVSAQAVDKSDLDEISVTEIDHTYAAESLPLGFIIVRPRLTNIAPVQTLNQSVGINIQQGSGSESLTAIRSPVLTGGAGAGSFYYGINGVSVRATGFGNVNGFLDLPFGGAKSIEILKGPQPILLGSNALHGGVMARFDADRANGSNSVSVTLGSDDFMSAAFARTAGSDLGQSRFAAHLQIIHDGGFRAQSGYDKQTALLSHEFDMMGDWELSSFLALTNLNQETAGFVRGEDAYKNGALALSNEFPEAYRDVKSFLLGTRISKTSSENGKNYLTEFTPYIRVNEMDFKLHFLPGQAREQNDHSSIGLAIDQYVTSTLLNVSFGFLADFTQGQLYEFQDNETQFSYIQGLHYDFDVRARQLSAYANVNTRFSDRFRASFGLRAENTHYDYDNRTNSGTFGRFLRLEDREDAFSYMSQSARLVYDFTPSISGYMRMSSAARPPQISDLYRVQLNQADGRADVEVLDSIEVGVQGQVSAFSTWEIAAYDMRKRNFFFRDADGFNVVDGRTKHRGVEASVSLYLTDHWTLKSNMSLERHSYDFDRNVGNISEVIMSGNRIDTAPDVQGYAELSYEANHWELGISWTHMGEYFTNAANTQDYPGHDTFGLTVNYDISDDVRAVMRVDNLMDVYYAYRADFAFGHERYFPGRPRSLYLGVSKSF